MTRWVLGVDLGTSFSAGAVADGDRVKLLEVGGDGRIPSTVLLTEEERLLAGTHAQRAIGTFPDRAERNPKRYVGRAPMLLGGEPVTAVDALAALLELFVVEARRRYDGTDPARVVLTHPVTWSDAQRGELREVSAQVVAGVEVVLLAEPVAAAVHYLAVDGNGRQPGNVAVYDLGGGTFDTAVLTADGDGFRVVGRPAGDPDIGGDSFDQLVYRHWGAQLEHSAPEWWEQVRTNPERRWLASAADLLSEARIAKESLSEYESASRYVPGADADVALTRAELDELIGADVRRTAQLLAETIEMAGGELRGVFLAGGASRTPLVERTLRESYDSLVRTCPDPKTVVALGAARWGLRRAVPARPAPAGSPAPPARPVPARPVPARPVPARPVPAVGSAERGAGSPSVRSPHPAGRPPSDTARPRPSQPAGPFTPIADAVLDARPAAGAVYTWSVPDGPTSPHRIARRDPRTGRAEREVSFGEVTGWALSDAGVVIAERRDAVVFCHVLGSDLAVRSSTPLPTGHDPFLAVDGELAWVVLRSPRTQGVGPADGMGWGEIGELAVQVIRLGTATAPPGPAIPLGSAAFWYLDENGQRRRLLDPTAPSTSIPAAFGDQVSCAMVVGLIPREPASRTGRLRFAARDAPPVPRQTVGLIGPAGGFTPIAEQRARDAETPWVYQLLQFGGAQPLLLSTSVGLETYGDLRLDADRRLFLPRPQAGACRWVRAGRQAYGVAVEGILPGRGLSLHVLVDGRRRDLGRWPSLLGSPTSVRATEAPRVRVDGEQIWVGAGDGAGGSHLVLADPAAARVVVSAPGWLEPVGRAGGVVLALHAPGTPPGDGRSKPGSLVRLPG